MKISLGIFGVISIILGYMWFCAWLNITYSLFTPNAPYATVTAFTEIIVGVAIFVAAIIIALEKA